MTTAPSPLGARSAPARPLLVTDEPQLLDDLLRLAAAADVEVTVAHTPAHAHRDWSSSPLVVVGSDLAAAVAEQDPPRHARTVLVQLRPFAHVGAGPDGGTEHVWRTAVKLGAAEVLDLPDDETRLVELLAEPAASTRRPSALVGVIGGRGGAGASVLASALATAGARARMSTLLIDADPLGGGIDLLLGQEHCAGARWPDFVARQGRMNSAALRSALPSVHGLAVLTWDRGPMRRIPGAAMRAVLGSAAGGADLVVADLPRNADDATVEVLRRAAVILLVVPAEVRAVVAATAVAGIVGEHAGELRLVLRTSTISGLTCEVISNSMGYPVAGELPAEPGLDRALNRGDAPGRSARSPLAAFSDSFVHALRERPRVAP